MSVGSVGDGYDNALAETVIWLFKTKVVKQGCGSYFWVKRLQRGKPSNRGSRPSACFRGSI